MHTSTFAARDRVIARIVDRTTVGSAAHQPYGVAASIIGRMDPGWQTNSRSLVFDARWTDVWRELAESGPDHGKKNHDSVPFNRRSQKKNGLACANGQVFGVEYTTGEKRGFQSPPYRCRLGVPMLSGAVKPSAD